MKHIKFFEQKALYESYINGKPILPNVSYTLDTDEVFYNPYVLQVPQIDLTGIENGIYAVTSDYRLVTEEEADETCIAVAIINDVVKIMIALITQDTCEALGFSEELIYGPLTLNTQIPLTNSVFVDINGKQHTENLIRESEGNDIAALCKTFNETESVNLGFNDWYIPAVGQLSEFIPNPYKLQLIFEKIGLDYSYNSYGLYWSSSLYSETLAWLNDAYDGISLSLSKDTTAKVRLIRDIEPVKGTVFAIGYSLEGDPEQINVVSENTTWETFIQDKEDFTIDDEGYVRYLESLMYLIDDLFIKASEIILNNYYLLY